MGKSIFLKFFSFIHYYWRDTESYSKLIKLSHLKSIHESKLNLIQICSHRKPQITHSIYLAAYIIEWTNTILKAVQCQRKLGHADEDIGIILRVGKQFRAHYIMLFQRLTAIFSKAKISLQFDFESLSQEKTVVIICGLKIWCPTIF